MTKIDFSKKEFIRDAVGKYMITIGEKNETVLIVNADSDSTCRNKEFVEKYPERCFNVGIAEQNMVSFAAGLAHEGFVPFAFTMAPFMSMRACEQCRTDVAYANLNVRLIAPYAGLSGGISGATHWAMEDVAIMCAMPNMTVLEPCDTTQAKLMLEESLEHHGPIYMRVSVEPTIGIYDENMTYEFGRAIEVLSGDDGAFICCGITVKYAIIASQNIEKKTGKHIRVIDMHTIKPIDKEAIVNAATTGHIVAAQDHNIIGGLGTYVAQVLAENSLNPKFAIAGIPDKFVAMAHAPYLYHEFGYDDEGLEKTMLKLLDNK